ncbi:MAG: phosphatidate cytidylyltransferase [Haloplasmataceae bacterium]|jgi:phosphatidate cytidylyltransferase|nr:phosphatidate cytidylyltransferase [Haloplasmataceae bacterium]
MKQRVLTGISIIAVFIPIFYFKIVYNVNEPVFIIGLILAVIAMNEMLSMKETEKKLPIEVHLAAYFVVIYLSFIEIFSNAEFGINLLSPTYNIGLNIVPVTLAFLAIIMVIRKNFKLNEAGFLFFTIFYVGFSFQSLVYFLGQGIYQLLYIIFVAICTDTFAYFSGYFLGKHKLAPIISPKKTIEGAIGGTLATTIFVSIFAYYNHIFDNKSVLFIVIITLILSIISQFGDLIASVMKRQYKIKDYGNLFPGHGGVLDRLDSILFTALSLYYLNEIFNVFFTKSIIG